MRNFKNRDRQFPPTRVGIAADLEFAKYAILGGNGLLEAGKPFASGQGRDFLLHLKDQFEPTLSVSVKCRRYTAEGGRLMMWFPLKKRPKADPASYYFFAYFDPKTMSFRDPVFLMPAAVIARLAKRRRKDGMLRVDFLLNLHWDSRDQFTRYRLPAVEIGDRLVDILQKLASKPRRTN